MTQDELESVNYAASTLLYPEFDYLIETFRDVSKGSDSLSTFVAWLAFNKLEYNKIHGK